MIAKTSGMKLVGLYIVNETYMFENEKQEDYMGMISWSRISCGSTRPHFGTEVKTSQPIRLEISTAKESRDLSHNWYFADKKLLKLKCHRFSGQSF